MAPKPSGIGLPIPETGPLNDLDIDHHIFLDVK